MVIAATGRRASQAHGGALRVPARHNPLALGGADADADLAERVHATALPSDMRLSVAQGRELARDDDDVRLTVAA